MRMLNLGCIDYFSSRIFDKQQSDGTMIDRIRACFFSFVADGNTAGTGPGDPWTGSGGGVQPPYSGYAPPHLAQPAYPMHLPHDPMVSDFSSISLSLSLLSTFSSFLTPIPTTF